ISFALLTTHLPPSRRPAAMGLFAVLQGVGALAGPLIGGWLTANVGWRAAFFVSLPAMAAIAWLVLRMPADASANGARKRFDVAGLVLVNAAATLVLLAITSLGSARAPWYLAGSAAALALAQHHGGGAGPVAGRTDRRDRRRAAAQLLVQRRAEPGLLLVRDHPVLPADDGRRLG